MNLTSRERSTVEVLASWLNALRVASAFAQGILLAGLLLLFFVEANSLLAKAHVALLMLLGLLERYFAVRLAFDASLFAKLGRGEIETLSSLDEALNSLALKCKDAAITSPRSLEDRVSGTRGLVRSYFFVLAIMLIVFGAIFFLYGFRR